MLLVGFYFEESFTVKFYQAFFSVKFRGEGQGTAGVQPYLGSVGQHYFYMLSSWYMDLVL